MSIPSVFRLKPLNHRRVSFQPVVLSENGHIRNLDILRVNKVDRPKGRILPCEFFDLDVFAFKTLEKPWPFELQGFRISRPPIDAFSIYDSFAREEYVFNLRAVENRAVKSTLARC